MPKNPDSSRAIKKMERLKREFPLLLNFILTDAGNFFRLKLVDEQLAGAPGTIPVAAPGAKVVVGRQSGNLARSYFKIIRKGLSTIITSAPGVANYALDVAKFVKFRQGRDYLRVTQFYYEPVILKGAMKAVQEWLLAVDRRIPWLYRNPYPTG